MIKGYLVSTAKLSEAGGIWCCISTFVLLIFHPFVHHDTPFVQTPPPPSISLQSNRANRHFARKGLWCDSSLLSPQSTEQVTFFTLVDFAFCSLCHGQLSLGEDVQTLRLITIGHRLYLFQPDVDFVLHDKRCLLGHFIRHIERGKVPAS